MPSARRHRSGPGASGPLGAGGLGSPVSPGDLLQRLRFQRLIGDDALQPGVLALEFPEALGVVGLHPAVLVTPTVIRRLRDLQGLADLGDRLALAEHAVAFAQLADDLLGGVPALLQVIVPVSSIIMDA